MRLYYSDDMVCLWNGDSRRLSPVSDETVDLVLTSPPYWNEADYGHADQVGYGHEYEDYLADLTTIFGECRRCLRPGGRAVVWVADLFFRNGRPNVPLAADVHGALRRAGLHFETTIFSHSCRAAEDLREPLAPLSLQLACGPQQLLVYAKDGTRPEPPPEALAASRIPPAFAERAADAVWVNPPGRPRDSLGVESAGPDWAVIRFWTLVGDTVLDPFAGAASLLVTAKKLGRRAIGTEVNEKTCAQAAANLQAAVACSHLNAERTANADS